MNPSTERPRRGELVEMGVLLDSGRRAKTKSGRNTIIWNLAPCCCVGPLGEQDVCRRCDLLTRWGIST